MMEEVEMLDFGPTNEGDGEEETLDPGAAAQTEDTVAGAGNTTTVADGAAAAAAAADKGGTAKQETDFMLLPPHGSEVFISRLPKGFGEEQLRGFLGKAGEIHQLRMPRNATKGFAFCVYTSKESADKAIIDLHDSELEAGTGRKVAVVRSDVNNKLYIGGLPRDMSQDAVRVLLEQEVRGVTGLDLVTDRETKASRGFAFVEFYNTQAAEAARKALTRPGFRLQGREVTVTFAEPRRSDRLMEVSRSLHVSGLPTEGAGDDWVTTTETALRDMLSPFGKIESIALPQTHDEPHKPRGFGFVHFEARASALKALAHAESGGQPFKLGEAVLKVSLAKPQAKEVDAMEGGRGMGGPRGLGRGGGGRHGYAGAGGAMRGGYGRPMGYDDYYAGGAGGAQVPFGPFVAPVAMVPMMLPNGQVAYMMAPPGLMGGPEGGAAGGGRGSGRGRGAGRGGGGRGAGGGGGGHTGGGYVPRGYGQGAAVMVRPTGYGPPRNSPSAGAAGGGNQRYAPY